jgi:phage terminase large subunit
VIPNQGKGGAALQRIEALRRLFPKLYFDEERCAPGVAALEHYHAKIDEERQFSTGPEHDRSSHAAEALGLMAIAYRSPKELARFYAPIEYPRGWSYESGPRKRGLWR